MIFALFSMSSNFNIDNEIMLFIIYVSRLFQKISDVSIRISFLTVEAMTAIQRAAILAILPYFQTFFMFAGFVSFERDYKSLQFEAIAVLDETLTSI